MGLIRMIIGLPFVLWIVVGGVYLYFQHQEWEKKIHRRMKLQVQQEEQAYNALRNKNQLAEDFEKQKQEKLSLIQDLSKKLNSSREQLPRDSDLPTVLKLLADISDSTGLEFSRFEPAGEIRENFLVMTKLKVRLTGSYSQVMSFLDAVSNLKRIVAARSIDMRSPVKNGETTLLQAEAILVTYHIDGG